jgi:tetratricopeptide repeat protein
MSDLALTRDALGDLDGTRELQEEAVAGFRRVLGNDHRDTLVSISLLAETHGRLGDLDGARKLHEQALVSRRRLLGEDHPPPCSR